MFKPVFCDLLFLKVVVGEVVTNNIETISSLCNGNEYTLECTYWRAISGMSTLLRRQVLVQEPSKALGCFWSCLPCPWVAVGNNDIAERLFASIAETNRQDTICPYSKVRCPYIFGYELWRSQHAHLTPTFAKRPKSPLPIATSMMHRALCVASNLV